MAAGDDKSGLNIDEQRRIAHEKIANYQKVINELEKDRLKNGTDNLAQQEQLQAELNKIIRDEKELNVELAKGVKHRQRAVDIAKQLGGQLKLGWKYLQDQDKIIKTTNLNLGMSGAKAAAMRDSFEKSAGYVARLGGSIADVATVMQGYADETGRARAMSAEMVKDITDIGKGTGLGIAEATRLGAQFELMGFDAKSTMDYVQGVVDTSERMGVNTTKVLKTVNDNFKRLNTYTFQQGVKGFAQMAMYAEKFKIDINQALNAADVARSLEGAIDLAAQLQIMGGEFAKTDPFEMLFLARNDPAKFTEKIADMTKGIVSFRKMADGTFEKFISPADRDRLAAVAKSMGMEASALTEITERTAEIEKMRQNMGGMGFTAEQREAIEGAGIYNKKTGEFQVKLAGTMTNIRDLTTDQAKAFEIESVALRKRAEEAMTFSDTFKATIEILKVTLLPLLNVINEKVLPKLGKLADKLVKFSEQGMSGVIKAAGILMGAGLLWKGVTNKLGNVVGKWIQGTGGKGISGFLGKGSFGGGGLSEAVSQQGSKSGLFEQRKGIGMGKAAAGQGKKMMGAGAGFGVAMAGAGAGVMLAAKGISQLADSMAKLTPEQAESLAKIVKSLSWFMVGAAAAAVGIMALGAAGTAGAVGLLAFGGAMALIGGGIFLATTGIGNMAKGLAELNKSGGGAGKEMMGVAGGVAAITLAMAGGGLVSLMAFNAGLKRMSKRSEDIEKIGTAFGHIQAVLSGSRDDFEAVEKAVKSIGSSNVKGGGYFAELSNLLKKPLQVEFANNGRVSMTNDITLNLDGKTFMNKAYDVNIAVQKHESLKHAKGS